MENWAGGGGFKQPNFDEVLYVTEDTYVRGGSDSDTNFGESTELTIKNSGEGHRNDRRTFLKFDLSSLPTPIYDVRLRLNVDNDAPNPTLDAVHYVSDDSWSEGEMTYNTQPDGGELIDTAMVPPNGAWIEFDLTNAVRTEMNSDGILSLRITASEEGATLHAYSSKEEEGLTNEPQLAYNLVPGGLATDDYCDRTTTSTDFPSYEPSTEISAFTLLPNPVREELTLQFNEPGLTEDVYIHSISGGLIRELKRDRNRSSLRIYVADLPAGIYLIRVGRETQKFIKM